MRAREDVRTEIACCYIPIGVVPGFVSNREGQPLRDQLSQ